MNQFHAASGRAMRSRWASSQPRFLFALALGLLAFSWPLLVNRNVFLLADTTAYMRGPDAIATYLTGRRSEWSLTEGPNDPAASAKRSDQHVAIQAQANAPGTGPAVVLAGRSVYYGAVLFVVTALGGFALMAFLQAAMAVGVAAMTARRLAVANGVRLTPVSLAGTLATLGVATPVGFFAAYMVPDLFAGLGGIALAIIAVFHRAMSRRETWAWWFFLAASLTFHSANLLIFGAMILLIGVIMIARGQRSAFPAGLLISALLVGLLSEAVFSMGVAAATGSSPVRPPFVAARLIDDGAGRTYLRDRCAKSDFLLCKWRQHLPVASDGILWGGGPGQFSFAAATPEQKRLLAHQEIPFVIAVIRDRPLEVIAGSSRSFVSQLQKWRLREFNYSGADRLWFEGKVPADSLAMLRSTRAWSESMPTALPASLSAVTFGISLLFLVVMRRRRISTQSWRFVGILIAIIVLDALVAGTLSTPHDRYLMRVVWIVPLAALSLVPTLFSPTRDGDHDPVLH